MSPNVTIPVTVHLSTSALPFIVENIRNKRQIWHGYGYDSYFGYGFQWSRIILFILLLITLFLCCLVPCICALGIWFAGWFGLRNRVDNKGYPSFPVPTNVAYTQQQPPIIPQATTVPYIQLEFPNRAEKEAVSDPTPSVPGDSRERMDSYIYEEKRSDHYYHRPQSPRLEDNHRRNFTPSRL